MAKPFLTPEFTSLDIQCRTLKTPANKEWLGVFNSALLEMLRPYNWEQVENADLTIEQSIAICEAILAEFFLTPECADDGACLQPSGSRVIRLNSAGHFEQLANGGWIEPTDDYAVPAVPDRAETTPEDRRCAAAANAANVLKATYEAVTDAINLGLDEAEIQAAFVAVLLTLIGAWLSLAALALLAILASLFRAFIEIAEFMTIDLWDEDFDEVLECLLYSCSTDTDDVVTFDLDCISENYAATVDLLNPNALDQLRLYGQIWFMLSVIGVDGLNAAGATTAITDMDCTECQEWCHEFDFEFDDGGWAADILSGNTLAQWVSGQGWQRAVLTGTSYRARAAFIHIDVNAYVTSIGVETVLANHQNVAFDYDEPFYPAGTGAQYGETDALFTAYPAQTVTTLGIGIDRGGVGLTSRIVRIVLNGTGDNPFSDNCD